MFHHSTITEDPDVRKAAEDFRATVVEIRVRSARLFELSKQHDEKGALQRTDEQTAIDDLVGTMQARCERVGLTLDDLFRLINDDLRAQRNNPERPYGEYERALLDENTRAYGAERQLERERERTVTRHAAELAAVDRLLNSAVTDRIAADRAHAGYFAGWAVRGARL